jgi:hypothetical protein
MRTYSPLSSDSARVLSEKFKKKGRVLTFGNIHRQIHKTAEQTTETEAGL